MTFDFIIIRKWTQIKSIIYLILSSNKKKKMEEPKSNQDQLTAITNYYENISWWDVRRVNNEVILSSRSIIIQS